MVYDLVWKNVCFLVMQLTVLVMIVLNVWMEIKEQQKYKGDVNEKKQNKQGRKRT